MLIEVEQKFPVSDPAALERQLAALGAKQGETVVQVDDYFAHPQRDFAKSDEALRLRRVGPLNYITYKGPKLDAVTKTRREIEIPLAAGEQAAADAGSLLTALGFARVAEVRKRRMHSTLRWQNREVNVALDQIAELGHFVELEIVTDPADVETARACIASLASQLGLTNSERRSYLELLLESPKRGSTP
jgi:adenylate cyclase, class 2